MAHGDDATGTTSEPRASTSSVAGAETRTHPMQHSHRPASASEVPATLVPEAGWHFMHLFYRIDRACLAAMDPNRVREGVEQFIANLVAKPSEGLPQLQCFAVPGHKADFGVVMAGPDLRAIHAVQVSLQASAIGPALIPTYSFYSLTEVSEYVPDAEDYAKILQEREGLDPEGSVFKAKYQSYTTRLAPMNRQRLYPEFPDWPCLCFYPMSKMRQGDQNWYLLPFETRSELMSHHGRSGMRFAGRVSQVITASTGVDDWEWGVTLWARNPLYLKDIVYTMRFDESSARYALFGDFYFGYLLSPGELAKTVGLS